jgi:hypothetical protein
MSVIALPQTIELERGDALQLYWAVARVWTEACQAPLQVVPVPLDAGLLVALPLLKRLGKRLYRVSQNETTQVGKPKPKPRRFKMSCEEVAVVMRHVLPSASLAARPVLGKVQQKSLNLTSYIHF